jgi:hypothetical protein
MIMKQTTMIDNSNSERKDTDCNSPSAREGVRAINPTLLARVEAAIKEQPEFSVLRAKLLEHGGAEVVPPCGWNDDLRQYVTLCLLRAQIFQHPKRGRQILNVDFARQTLSLQSADLPPLSVEEAHTLGRQAHQFAIEMLQLMSGGEFFRLGFRLHDVVVIPILLHP